MPLCSDMDLMFWEPEIAKQAAFASQTLMSGTGTVAGSDFTISAGSLAENHVENQQAIVLSGALSGCYAIASVESATKMQISPIYGGLLVGGEPSPVGSASGLGFVVRTFYPQRRIVSDLIQQAAGLGPGEEEAEKITNAGALKRVCALGTLQMIYSALAAAATTPAPLSARADLYERLYRRAIREAKVEVEEGNVRAVRVLGAGELARI